MAIGVALPDGGELGANAVDGFLDRAHEAHAAGLGAVWFSQQFSHDALSVAAVVGAAVPDLQIGTSVVPIYPRHPIVVSSQAQTAQAASHGRFTLGLGLGAPSLVEPAFGVSAARPVRHLREYLTILNALLATGAVDFDGESLTAHTPFPAAVAGADPPVPVLVAAMGPHALAAAGELADGTLPYLAGPRTLAEFIIPTITAAAERVGRSSPRIVVALPIVVTDEVGSVTDRARADLDFYSAIPSYRAVLDREGADHPAELAVIGSEDRVTEAIERYYAAGATDIIASQTGLHTEDDRLRTWQLLGRLHRERDQRLVKNDRTRPGYETST